MPEWITPELWPVWCSPSEASLSRTAREVPGRRVRISRAAARPTMPPPTITTSYLVMVRALDRGHELLTIGRPAGDDGTVARFGTMTRQRHDGLSSGRRTSQ